MRAPNAITPAIISRILTRLRRRGSDESGVVLILVAVLMTAFLGFAALSIDLGSYWQSQRQAQAAADAGALAASQDLPSSTASASTDGTNYAKTNYPGATVNVTPNYNGTTNQAKVTVTVTSPSFFGRFFGKTGQVISASAVAAAGAGGGANYAIFAKSTACGNTVYLEQGNMTLNGGIHSNGGMRASGHNNTYSSGTYGGPNNCTPFQDDSGGSNSFGGSTTPTVDSTAEPWPEDYSTDFPTVPLNTTNDPNCTYYGSDLSIQNASGSTLASGTYCYQTIEFNSSNLTCHCTFVASSSMQFNQGPDNFTPYFKDLQFYDMDTNNVNINANGTSFLSSSSPGGTIFIPNSSLVTVNAPAGTVYGFLEAQSIVLNGGGTTIWNGSGTPTGGSTKPPSLVQ